MGSEPIRVIIVDDHPMVRSGLRLFLLAFDDLKMVGEAANGEEAIRLCVQEKPHIVLMDLIMPVMDGIRATQEIHARFPRIRVIGLTSFFEPDLIEEMLQAGAVSFLMKNISATELADAIRNTYYGKATISADVKKLLKGERFASQVQKNNYHLSPREKEVLTCMATGLSNGEIADELSISLSTAKYHVSSILTKLDVSNRAEAVSLALQEGLVDVSSRSKKN